MQAYKMLSLNIELYRGKQMLDPVNVLGVDRVIYASFQIRESRQRNLHLNQKPKKLTSTPHYTERAHTVFRDPMVRCDQVIPGNLIFRDDSRAVCTGGHHIHIRHRFAPAAAALVQLRPSNMGYTCDANTSLFALHVLFYSVFAMANELLKSTRDRKRAVLLTPRKSVEGSSQNFIRLEIN